MCEDDDGLICPVPCQDCGRIVSLHDTVEVRLRFTGAYGEEYALVCRQCSIKRMEERDDDD